MPSSAPPPTGVDDHVRTFHPRRSRVTARQRHALDRWWPEHGLDVDGRRLDLATIFSGRPVVLEIGPGMGESTVALAQSRPDLGVLAVDVHTPGLGQMVHEAHERSLRNLRVARGDAVDLVSQMLDAGSLAGVYILFPDPWPKARHRKRRLIQPAFVSLLAGRLVRGGFVHCATDWAPYAAQMLAVLSAEPSLRNTRDTGDGYADQPVNRPLTRYARRGMAKGHRIHDLIFERV
jgi:tRNA (guanine-N7-)-methyltransferase